MAEENAMGGVMASCVPRPAVGREVVQLGPFRSLIGIRALCRVCRKRLDRVTRNWSISTSVADIVPLKESGRRS